MKIQIQTAERKILETQAYELILPGADGEFSVLDFHQPCVYSLKMGKIKIKARNTQQARRTPEEMITIKKGVAKVVANALVVLAEV